MIDRPSVIDALVLAVIGAVAGAQLGAWAGGLVGGYCGWMTGRASARGRQFRGLGIPRRGDINRREGSAEYGRGFGAAIGAVAGVALVLSGELQVSMGLAVLVGYAAGGALVGVIFSPRLDYAVFSVTYSILPTAGVGAGLWAGTTAAAGWPPQLQVGAGVLVGLVGILAGTLLAKAISAASGFNDSPVLKFEPGLQPVLPRLPDPYGNRDLGLPDPSWVTPPVPRPAATELRMTVLHLSADADLPLHYQYDTAARAFRTLGYVRAGGIMVAEVDHVGSDTTAERDRFLFKILVSLAIPATSALQIVRRALHVR